MAKGKSDTKEKTVKPIMGVATDVKVDYASIASTETNIADGFRVAAVGDVVFTRPVKDKRYEGMDELSAIMKQADVGFGNLESTVFDAYKDHLSPAGEYGGAYHISEPAVAGWLKDFGINMMSVANNHTLDWGVEGMRKTAEALEECGIVHAGSGENLSAAGAPRFLETDKGRVGLVAYCGEPPKSFKAADPVHEAPGRPGVNYIRINQFIKVNKEMLEQLRAIRDATSLFRTGDDREDRVSISVHLKELSFRLGEPLGRGAEHVSRDIDRVLWNVRQGKQMSDFLIVSDHTHLLGNWYLEPPETQIPMAHTFIDAGADAFIGHGSHHLRGIEIYKGRPIIYGLGNFGFDDLRAPVGMDAYDTCGIDPAANTFADLNAAEGVFGFIGTPGFEHPMFYETVIASFGFKNNKLNELLLYPVWLQQEGRMANRGLPMPAKGERALNILNRVAELSKPYNTRIIIEGDVGRVAL